MKKYLQLKPYKYYRCQELTEAHMQQRLEFCHWVLEDKAQTGTPDFWMQREIDAVIKDKKPESIAVLKEIVNECTRRMDRDKVAFSPGGDLRYEWLFTF